MKAQLHICFAVFLLATFLLGTGRGANANGIDDLSWMTGCWSHNTAEAGSVEMWTSPAGETLLGVSRTVKNAKTVAHEFMQIRWQDKGLVFIARPSDQSEASFRAIRASTSEVVFENLEHDFPQRVMYRLTAPGVMVARIEGTRDGKVRGIDYPMTKIACEAPTVAKPSASLTSALRLLKLFAWVPSATTTGALSDDAWSDSHRDGRLVV